MMPNPIVHATHVYNLAFELCALPLCQIRTVCTYILSCYWVIAESVHLIEDAALLHILGI